MRTHCLVLALLASVPFARAADMVPFVIPQEVSDKSLVALPALPAVATDGPRVKARDGHFFLGDERFRAWGVNFCFAANFPTHEQAKLTARRLSAFGVNAVRLHHMDGQAFPSGIWDPKDPLKLSAEALDRLDFFIDQLAASGIRTNLNLHVSRSHAKALKLPEADKLPSMDKIADLFTPELIAAQKAYARDLLGHVSAYRKVRYADDPAIAWVEINNEDSFFMWGADDTIRKLPEPYAGALRAKFVEYLKARYTDTAGLAKVWNFGTEPAGANLIADGRLATAGQPKSSWHLEQHEGCKADLAPIDGGGAKVTIAKSNATSWHLQLSTPGLALEEGKFYLLTFKARAAAARTIGAAVGQAGTPWKTFANRTVELGEEWKTFRLGFTSPAKEPNARVTFQVGGSDIGLDLDEVSLTPGGNEGLGKDETLEAGTVALYADIEPQARAIDRMKFLATLEKAYYEGMRDLIKKDLRCGALVTGTIVFGPLGLWTQSGMDYLDGHAYWQHPQFPGRPWDAENWIVKQEAMVDHPEQSPLFRLACERLEGKPYTVSEYNHPAPNDYQAECVPMVSSFAAAQDWDGVWLFAYSHTGDTKVDRIQGFFDIAGNPAKWAFMPAGARIFRDAIIPPLTGRLVIPLSAGKDVLADVSVLHQKHGMDLLQAVDAIRTGRFDVALRTAILKSPTFVSLDGNQREDKPNDEPESAILWGEGSIAAHPFVAAGGKSRRGEAATALVTVGGCTVISNDPDFGKAQKPTFFVMSLVTLPSNPRTALMTLCGRCENTEMKFRKDRLTVGKEWGKAPVFVETPAGFAFLGDYLTLQPLASDGTLSGKPRTPPRGGEEGKMGVQYNFLPTDRTIWYLVTSPKPSTAPTGVGPFGAASRPAEDSK